MQKFEELGIKNVRGFSPANFRRNIQSKKEEQLL